METQTYKIEQITINYDKKRKPLSAKQRAGMQGNYRYYGAQSVIDYVNDYLFDGEYLLIAEDGENLKSNKQNIAQIVEGQFWLNNHAHIVQTNDKCNIRYLGYWLNAADISGYITGSAQPKLSQGNLNAIEIELPERNIQDKIVDILYTLDQKIETNEAINRNLEEQAKTVFREWFIDNTDNITWNTGTFSDLIISTLGGDWGKEKEIGKFTEKVYCVRGADIPEVKSGNKGKMPTRFILPKNFSSKQLVVGDIVVEISGGSPTQSTGRIASISQSLLDRYDKGMICTNFCRALKPKDGYSMFINYYWQYLYDRKVFFLYENGTTGIKNLDINGFLENEEIIIPPMDMVNRFDEFCHATFDQIFKNGITTETLSETRDALLPKLMSGELDVSEIKF